MQYDELTARDIFPLKEANLRGKTLDNPLEWILGVSNILLKDVPSFATVTDAEAKKCLKYSAIIFNTFDAFEEQALTTISNGVLHLPSSNLHYLLVHSICLDTKCLLFSISSNLWREEQKCMEWLDQREPPSVV